MAKALEPTSRSIIDRGRRTFLAILLFVVVLAQSWNVAFVFFSPAANSTLPSIRGGGAPNTYMQLPKPNVTSPPISFDGCCGIGHRLSRNIPVMIYGISHSRPVHPHWTDVQWSVLFKNTSQIQAGPVAKEVHRNGFPANWSRSPLAYHELVGDNETQKYPYKQSDAYNRYGRNNHILFEMPLAHSILKSLSDNLGPLVLSFLEPMRAQYAMSALHLCTHVREGNNEQGDWAEKTWRHIDLMPTLNGTLAAMRTLANETRAQKVSVFVASDTPKSRSWFEANAPAGWHVVMPAKELPRPENGVWFGQHGSKTGANLSKSERDEAMAEAVADVFALGECDALFIPNYSSFSIVGIMLTRAERRKVFFRLNATEFVEFVPHTMTAK